MMAPNARWPRVAAWLVVLALVGTTTVASLWAVHQLAPLVPPGTRHAQGIVVALRPDGTFALRLAGQRALLWLRPAPGADISLDHLWRHMREHAPTDVTYQSERQGIAVAWSAD